VAGAVHQALVNDLPFILSTLIRINSRCV